MSKKTLTTKLAIFDFDGTLTVNDSNCWRFVWKEIGKAERDDELYGQFLQGKFSSGEWIEKVVEEFKDSAVNTELVDKIAKKLVLREGLVETFKYLKDHSIKIVIYSGGIKRMLISALGKFAELVDDIECDDLIFDKNGLVCGRIKSEFDTYYKYNFVMELMKKLNVKPNEVFFMGNGDNDESVHKTGATTLCVNPDKTNPYDKNCWDYYIEDIKNLKEIIPYIK